MSPLPAAQRWIVIGPFLLVVVLLAIAAAFGVEAMSITRAFAAGESAYAKGYKDALRHLRDHLADGSPQAWARYELAVAAPIGHREAREALEAQPPDRAAAREALGRAGHHADDLRTLDVMMGWSSVSPIAWALQTWRRADELIRGLDELARTAHAKRQSGPLDPVDLADTLARVHKVQDELDRLEQGFAARLDEASRRVQRVVMMVLLGLAAVIALAGVWLLSSSLQRQRQVEQALRESNLRWERAAAAAEIGLFELDVPRRRVRLDVRAGALFGMPLSQPTDLELSSLQGLLHPDDRPAVEAALRRASQDGRQLEMRFRVSRAVTASGDTLSRGLWRDLEINTRRAEAQPELMHGFLWDVTADVRAEGLRLEKEAAERSSRAKTEFLSRVSHELRTPLNAVLGFAQLMATDDREPLTATQRNRLAQVLASGRNLLGLINDVLDLSSIDQATFSLSRRQVDLAVLLREAVQRFEPIARPASVSLELVLPPEVPSVTSDPLRIEQVVSNLMSNAIKYNRPHGRVVVRLGFGAEDWQLEVEDTGRGMSAAAQQQLYQPFNRLGAEHGRIEGTGLGLVITRQVVQRLGGTIELRSEAGVGSTFTVRLPRELADDGRPLAAELPGSTTVVGQVPRASDAGGSTAVGRKPRGTAASKLRV